MPTNLLVAGGSPLLSMAYAPPVEYLVRLYRAEGQVAYIEACESFVKQSYRSRCQIAGPNGMQTLSIPIEHGRSNLIRDIRISEHGSWRHLHRGALMASYGSSPYFEYYWDDIAPFYERQYDFLWELNWELLHCLAGLIDLDISLAPTTDFAPIAGEPWDYRYSISPKAKIPPTDIHFRPYYQPFAERHGFIAGLSAFDLLFNLGPESLLLLRDS